MTTAKHMDNSYVDQLVELEEQMVYLVEVPMVYLVEVPMANQGPTGGAN